MEWFVLAGCSERVLVLGVTVKPQGHPTLIWERRWRKGASLCVCVVLSAGDSTVVQGITLALFTLPLVFHI